VIFAGNFNLLKKKGAQKAPPCCKVAALGGEGLTELIQHAPSKREVDPRFDRSACLALAG
jgi:hypothetical protein